LHVIAPSDEMFDYMVPKVYWRLDERTMPEDVKTELLKYYPRDYQKNNESSYNSACNKIKHLLDGNGTDSPRSRVYVGAFK